MRCGMRCKADWLTNSTPRSCRADQRPVDRGDFGQPQRAGRADRIQRLHIGFWVLASGRHGTQPTAKTFRLLVMGSDTYAHVEADASSRHANADDVALDRLTVRNHGRRSG